MSTPTNVLDQFRSFSYHHILVACSNQYTATVLSQQNDLEALQQLGAESVYNIPADESPIEGGDEGQYIVLINGMRDTRFTIQAATWNTLTASSVNSTDKGNSIAVDGSLTIREARGFKFLNEIDRAADAFRTDPTGILYILKTVFIGHGSRQDGTTYTELISDITPLKFILINVTGAFSPIGGEYKLDFVGSSNGGARFPQISRGAETIKFTPESVYLRDVMTQLTDKCSALALETRDTIAAKLKEEYTTAQEPLLAAATEDLRPVEYKITLEDPYNDDSYQVTDFDSRSTEKGTADSPGALNFGKSFTMEQAIQHILERCPKIKDDLINGNDGQRYRYKIFSELTMPDKNPASNATANTSNISKVVVEYRIRRFLELDNASVDQILGVDEFGQQTVSPTSSGTETSQQMLQNNLIQFDYYYTGKNVDIKNFDIKLNEGLIFMQTLTSTDNSMSAHEQQATGGLPTNSTVAVTNPTKGEFELRSRTPIYPSTTVKDVQSKNVGNTTDTTTFNSMLSRHAALESIEVELEIRGNPYLLDKSNRPATEEDNTDLSEQPQDEFNVLMNWDKLPALCKVNIRMPDNSDTPSGDSRPDFVDFWYNGYYYIYAMTHVFNEGEFTQKLNMLALPEKSVLQDHNSQELAENGEVSDTDNSQTNQTNTASQVQSDTADTTAPRSGGGTTSELQVSTVSYVETIKGGAAARQNVATIVRSTAQEAVAVTKPGRETA